MFGIGPGEMIFILIIVLLLFGSRLPQTMRSLGQGMSEFKKGMRDGQDDNNSSNRIP